MTRIRHTVHSFWPNLHDDVDLLHSKQLPDWARLVMNAFANWSVEEAETEKDDCRAYTSGLTY